jgi:predicted acetyltransferase
MIKIESIETLVELSEFKKAYFEQSSEALDGMWHFGFVPMAKHWGFYIKEVLVGFCCVNDEGYMLQFYLKPDSQLDEQGLFTLIAEQNSSIIGAVKGAFVSTAEPHYIALCLDNSSTFTVNALMYQLAPKEVNKENKYLDMELATLDQLTDFVRFSTTNTGAPEQWLKGYYSNLIERKELLGYWRTGQLIAAGECRLFDEYQTEYADLGMIVLQSERGKGIAGKVLTYLVKRAQEKGLKPICSTEKNNIGAKKAILRAGLLPTNRIVQFEFNHQ